MLLVASILRFACDTTSRVEPMPNIGTDASVTIWRGEPLEVQCSLFRGDPSVATNFISDLTGIVSATLSIRRYGPNGQLLAIKTVAAGAFDPTTTYATWSDGSKQQIRFDFADAETQFALPSDGTLAVFGVVNATLNSGSIITVGHFEGVVALDGSSTGGVPLPPLEQYYTKAQVDASFQPLDSDLTSIATQGTVAFGRGLLILPDGPSVLSYIGGTSFNGKYTALDFTGGNLTSIPTRNFADVQNKPTTVGGYGITDAVLTTDIRLSDTRIAKGVKTVSAINISTLADPLDQQVLLYDAVLGQWRPGTVSGSITGTSTAAGAPTQMQYNNASALGGVAFLTFDGNTVVQIVGSKYNVADPTDTSKRVLFDPSNLSTGVTRNVVFPDANSVTIQPKTAATHKWFSSVTALGLLVDTQPAFSDLTGNIVGTQLPAFTGDVTIAGGTTTTVLTNIPTGVTQVGYILATNIPSPTPNPAAGKTYIYVDSTSKNHASKNDAGVVTHGVQTKTATTSQWIRSIADDGSVVSSQPVDSDLVFSDITTNNSTTTRHGYLPKLGGSAGTFLDGTGAWSIPSSAAATVTRPLFASTADKTVANTTVATSLVAAGQGSMTTTAGYLTAGRCLRITASGYYSTTGSVNLTFTVKYGATTAVTGTVSSNAALTNTGWALEAFITCRTTGSTGTISSQGCWTDTSGYNKAGLTSTATTTIDTTAAQAWDVTLAWSVAGAGLTLTCTTFVMDTPAQSGQPGSVWRTGTGAPSNALGSDGDFYLDTATGNVWHRASGTYTQVANIMGPAGVAGSVTSVGLALPASVFSITGSPVTGAGTLTGSFTNQTINTIFCGPSSGGANTPTFRSLSQADIPSLDWSSKIINKPTTLSGYGITDAAADASVVHLAGNETITGTKTFNVLPVWPTQSNHAFWCGPISGGPLAPSFRALDATDLPTNIPNASLANSSITIQGSAVALGGSTLSTISTPQFRRIGLNQAADANAFVAATAGLDGITLYLLKRALDTSPTGNFESFMRADGTSAVWNVDITGTLTAGTIPAARISGTAPTAANALITATTKPIATTADPTDGQVLTYSVSTGKWGPLSIPPPAGLGTATSIQTLTVKSISTTSDPTDGQVLQYSASTGKWGPATVAGGGGGTVTQVGLAMPAAFTVTGSPVNTTGTLTAAWATGQSPNLFLATPTGATGAVSLRTIAAVDLPGSFAGFANPSALVGLTAVAGTAATAMRSDGAPALDVTIVPVWSGLHTFKQSDAATSTTTDSAIFGHNSSGTPLAGYGGSVRFQLKSSTTNDRDAAREGAVWTSPADASRTSAFVWQLVNNAGALTEVARLFASGGFSVNSTTDPGAGTINAATGFRIANAATSGNVLRGNGTNFVAAQLAEADLGFTDITTNNSTTTAHGFLKKLSNVATQYMDGTGNWSVPAGGGGGGDFSSNTSVSVDSEIVLFSGTGGKTGKRATGTGIAKITSGVLSTATAKTDYWDTTDMVASGASHAHGLVPDPGAAAGTTRFLREDGTWVAPSGTGDFSSNTSVSVDSEIVLFSGTGGKTGKRATGTGIAKITSGVLSTATAKTDYWDTTDFVASGGSHAHGLVPDPGATVGTTRYLREDATWVAIAAGDFSSNTSTSVDSEIVLFSGTGGKTGKRATGTGIAKITSGVLSTATAKTDYWDTTVFVASGASHAIGLVPDPGSSAGTTRFLREDATWQTIPVGGVNARTTSYSAAASDNLKLITMNGASLTLTLPNPPPSSSWLIRAQNLHSTTLTIDRNTLQINGGTSNLTVPQYATVQIMSDGTNYFTSLPNIAGTGITITTATNGLTISTPVFVASGGSHAIGAVPDPGSTAGTTRYLREDATWVAPVDDTAFASSWNGVTATAPSKNAVYDQLHLMDTNDNGKVNVLDTVAGLVKTDASGVVSNATAKTDYWDTTDFVASGSGHAHGLVPDPGATLGTTKFLREDGTWVVPSGAGGTPGGSSGNLQYNNAGAFGGITNTATDGTTLNLLVSDTGTNTVTTNELITHNSSGVIAANFGASLLYNLQSSTTADRNAGQEAVAWSTATDASRTSYFDWLLVKSAAALTSTMRLFASGSLNLGGNTVDAGVPAVTIPSTSSPNSVYTIFKPRVGPGNTITFSPNTVTLVGNLAQTTTLVDQTAIAEQSHISFSVSINSSAVGAIYEIVAYGNIDNGTTAITYIPTIRWGGTGGTVLLNGPTIISTTTALTNKTWFMRAYVQIVTLGTTGTARAQMSISNHTASSTGAFAQDESDSGTTAVTINTATTSVLTFDWAMSSTTGTPHVRTIGGWINEIKN